MSKKKKIFVLADHQFTPSGVGTQTRYFIEALLKTGRYSFVCFGGAIRHENYQPMKTHEWGEDWISEEYYEAFRELNPQVFENLMGNGLKKEAVA